MVEERSDAPTKSTVLSAAPASVNNKKTGDNGTYFEPNND
jgi:hypothetical protein